jgi:hypothetical protein
LIMVAMAQIVDVTHWHFHLPLRGGQVVLV